MSFPTDVDSDEASVWDRVPVEFARVSEIVVDELPGVLGEHFVGLYLHGSLLDDSFVPGRSDMDCIAVTDRPLSGAEFERLDQWLRGLMVREPIAARLQVSFLVASRVLEVDPGACLFQFGALTRSGSHGNPIVWFDVLERGSVLAGAEATSFLPPIGSSVVRSALSREVGYLREGLAPGSEWHDEESYRAYAVLTLCRILYTYRTGELVSKSRAAAWARSHLTTEFAQLIEVAVGVSEQSWIARTRVEPITRFLEFVANEIGGAP